MKYLGLLAFCLAACNTGTTDKIGPPDTSGVSCDRIHGATGVLLMDGETHFPDEAPDAVTRTTSVSAALDDGRVLAIAGGELLVSEDGGCNWTEPGSRLPGTGDWDLVVQGSTAFAFDRASASVATSTDGALSWQAYDSGEPFLGAVVADATVAGRLRGVQVRGVVTSDDQGATWTAAGGAPPAAFTGGAVYAGDLDVAAATWTGGVLVTKNGGQSWEEAGAELAEDGAVPSRIAFSTESPDAMWTVAQRGDDVVIYFTTDGGRTWADAATSRSTDLDPDARLWPIPGQINGVVSAWGTTQDDYGINVYEILAGDIIHTTHTSAYYHVHDVSFLDGGDWLIGVDGVR